ncbi:MAG: hypothetical protein R3308_05975, partial [Thiohalobacterales bacterium]|nr:hypothetical protein [Thiohalobacterales bacterium]
MYGVILLLQIHINAPSIGSPGSSVVLQRAAQYEMLPAVMGIIHTVPWFGADRHLPQIRPVLAQADATSVSTVRSMPDMQAF